MGDVHIEKPEPNAVGAKVEELIASGHELYATALTGTPAGRVRRPTLFLIAGTQMVLAGLGIEAAAVIAIAALLLLALTDTVVDLNG